jgi:hypothetical protein
MAHQTYLDGFIGFQGDIYEKYCKPRTSTCQEFVPSPLVSENFYQWKY